MEDRISQEIRDSAPCWLRLQDPLPLVCNFKQMWANGHCPASQLLWTYPTKGSVFFVILTTCCTFCLFHKKEHIFLGTSQKEHTESLAYRWSDPQSTTSQVSSYRRSWDPMEQVWGVWPNLRKLFWGRCGYHYRAKGEASKIKNKKKLRRDLGKIKSLDLRFSKVRISATSRAVWDTCWVGYFAIRQCMVTFTCQTWRQYSQSLSEQKEWLPSLIKTSRFNSSWLELLCLLPLLESSGSIFFF